MLCKGGYLAVGDVQGVMIQFVPAYIPTNVYPDSYSF